MPIDLSEDRRRFLQRSLGTMAALPMTAWLQPSAAAASAPGASSVKKKNVVKAISSANGLAATKRAYELLLEGADTLHAAVEGVTIAENDPDDLTVGYGGLPNENGVVELDAAVMHGPTHRGGAVASLQNIRNPARLARLVLEQTNHVLLVGDGALEFARAHGFPEENLLTEKARRIWLYWKQTLSDKDDWLPPQGELHPDVVEFFKLSALGAPPADQHAVRDRLATGDAFERPTGTIHCAAIDSRGDISCTTTTSGLAFKIPGRVGDSPILGAGLYVDNEIGSCGSTGRGEANLQNLCSFAAVELMRNGAAPREAGLEVLRRVVAHTHEKHLLDDRGRPKFNLKFYLLGKDGRHAGVAMWGPSDFAVTDQDGTRLEPCDSLYSRGK